MTDVTKNKWSYVYVFAMGMLIASGIWSLWYLDVKAKWEDAHEKPLAKVEAVIAMGGTVTSVEKKRSSEGNNYDVIGIKNNSIWADENQSRFNLYLDSGYSDKINPGDWVSIEVKFPFVEQSSVPYDGALPCIMVSNTVYGCGEAIGDLNGKVKDVK